MELYELPENMEKYRWLLENQYELAKLYNQDRRKAKLEKNREEKHRWKINRKRNQ